jgi:hypothetical protein
MADEATYEHVPVIDRQYERYEEDKLSKLNKVIDVKDFSCDCEPYNKLDKSIEGEGCTCNRYIHPRSLHHGIIKKEPCLE